MDTVSRRVLANTDQLIRSLQDLPGASLCSPVEPERRSGIVRFSHERFSTQQLFQHLSGAGVSCVIRGNAIRLSPHFYQGEKQLEAFMNILEAL